MSSSVQAETGSAPGAGLRVGLQRERALIAFVARAQRKGLGLLGAALYAFGVFVTYAIGIALARGSDRRAVIQGLMHAALGSLSWVVGALAAFGTAGILAQQAEGDGLRALASQRGFDARAVWRARTLASALRIARLLGIPALLLVGVAVARGQSLAWAIVTAPAAIVYAAALGLCLAILAHVSAALSPRHPRVLLAALLLMPLLISQAYPAVPSLQQVFAALLDGLFGIGAALT